ncbi:MAG: type II toxin-antitoxin system VapC family toxin [Betaproteobacteria bacterium]|nr:type II toxin-antitoxin system VapC family toxin [Betaproteobacteria bacterium]
MIGLDTNILVRYFAQDDAGQSALANKLIASLSKEQPGFVSLIVLCELVWVLEDAYAITKPRIVDILNSLLQSDELVIEEKASAWAALTAFRDQSLDYSDALIAEAGKLAGCRHTLTFDKSAAKSAGFALLKGR